MPNKYPDKVVKINKPGKEKAEQNNKKKKKKKIEIK